METINTIIAIIAGIFGAGWGFQFLYYRYERRKREAESKAAELDVDAKGDTMRNKMLSDAYEMNMKMQVIIDKERDARIELIRENTDLKLKLADKDEKVLLAEFAKCTRDGCMNRIPPRIKDISQFTSNKTIKA